MGTTTRKMTLLLVFTGLAPLALSHTAEDWSAFTWDLSREFVLMRTPAVWIAAAPAGVVEPAWLDLGTHYSATLLPQRAMKFVRPPNRALTIQLSGHDTSVVGITVTSV
jgi:hypothetical protein